MKTKPKEIRRTLAVCLVAAAIPALLIVNGIQARRFANLSDEVDRLERRQEELIEENKKIVTDISLLSSTERIEKIAEEELGMHKAESSDIVRVEMKGGSDD